MLSKENELCKTLILLNSCQVKKRSNTYMYFGSFQQKEMLLTDEEEAIKANLIEGEALPMEVLDGIVLDWWMKEPFR